MNCNTYPTDAENNRMQQIIVMYYFFMRNHVRFLSDLTSLWLGILDVGFKQPLVLCNLNNTTHISCCMSLVYVIPLPNIFRLKNKNIYFFKQYVVFYLITALNGPPSYVIDGRTRPCVYTERRTGNVCKIHI